MEEKIKTIMATVFGIDSQDIADITSPDNVDTWDSINHLNLVVAIEEEFEIEFDEEEIINLVNYELIKEYVLNKFN